MAKITSRIHSLDGLDDPLGIYMTPYIVEEGPDENGVFLGRKR